MLRRLQRRRSYEQLAAIIFSDFTVNVGAALSIVPCSMASFFLCASEPETVTLWPTCLRRSADEPDRVSVAGAIESWFMVSFAIESFCIESVFIDFLLIPADFRCVRVKASATLPASRQPV